MSDLSSRMILQYLFTQEWLHPANLLFWISEYQHGKYFTATFIKWICFKVICPCPKGLVNVKIYFELKTFFLGLLFRLLMILCVVLFPLKMHMLPPSNDPCIIFSLKNACLSSKYAIFIRDLCPETRYPAC